MSGRPDGKDERQWASFLHHRLFIFTPNICFPIFSQVFFILKEKYSWKNYYKIGQSKSLMDNGLHGVDGVQQPWEFRDCAVSLWVPMREEAEQCCVGSAWCPSPMRWTPCLYHIASPKVITSGRTASDIVLPLLRYWQKSDRLVGHGLIVDTAEQKSKGNSRV